MKALQTIKQCLHRIDNEYDRVALEEAIVEIEELMKPKTCEVCTYYIKAHESINPWMGGKSTKCGNRCGAGVINGDFTEGMVVFNCNRYEPKG
jgi:hypothetical protein